MITTSVLNLRSGPGVNYTINKVLPLGTTVTTIGSFGDPNWVAVKYVQGSITYGGWCATQYLSNPLVSTKKKIGLHITAGSYDNSLLDMIKDLSDKGSPIPLIVVVNHMGLPAEIKRLSPSTFVVYRPVGSASDPSPDLEKGVSGESWFADMWYKMEGAKGADAYQFVNEWFGGNERTPEFARKFGQFYVELMRAANRKGVKVTVGDFAVGTIEMQHFEAMRPMFAMAEADGHYLNYHAYTSVNNNKDMYYESLYFAMRWVDWHKQYPNLKVVLGEAGSFDAKFYDVDTTIKMMKQLQDMIDHYPYHNKVVGAAWWSLACDNYWQHSEFKAALPAYKTWMLG